MRHNTTSWNSHRNTWRCAAGNGGRSREGGNARRVGGPPTLARQKTVGQHDQGEMPMQPLLAPALIVIQAALARGPVHPYGEKLLAQDEARGLAPGDRLPVLLRRCIQHGRGRIPRRGPRLLGLAPPPGAGGPAVAARTSSGNRTPKVLLTPTT
jgi:hypothetical protein